MARRKARVNRQFKASLFEIVFRNRENLLQLYNAMNGTNYTNPNLIQITTLEGALYLSVKNDTSFLIESVMNLYEHQYWL